MESIFTGGKVGTCCIIDQCKITPLMRFGITGYCAKIKLLKNQKLNIKKIYKEKCLSKQLLVKMIIIISKCILFQHFFCLKWVYYYYLEEYLRTEKLTKKYFVVHFIAFICRGRRTGRRSNKLSMLNFNMVYRFFFPERSIL